MSETVYCSWERRRFSAADFDTTKGTDEQEGARGPASEGPYVLVVGDKEAEAGTVAVRERGGNEKRGVPPEAFLARAVDESKSRALETADLGALG
jgi:hypothetical protein